MLTVKIIKLFKDSFYHILLLEAEQGHRHAPPMDGILIYAVL